MMRTTLLSNLERLALLNFTRAVDHGQGGHADVMAVSRILATDRVQVLGAEIREIVGKLRAPQGTSHPMEPTRPMLLTEDTKRLIKRLADNAMLLAGIVDLIERVGDL